MSENTPTEPVHEELPTPHPEANKIARTGMRNDVSAIIPTTMEQTLKLAALFANSGMVPKDYAGQPEKIAVAIMHGSEVGLPPMCALQSIAVINGRPSLWGDGALGVVQSSPLYEKHEEMTLKEIQEQQKAVFKIWRRGNPKPHVGYFDVEMAKEAGLWMRRGKNGQPTPWVTYRWRQLQMRARGFGIRDGFASVLRGMGITEEVMDIPIRDVEVEIREVPQSREVEPEPVDVETVIADVNPDAEPIPEDKPVLPIIEKLAKLMAEYDGHRFVGASLKFLKDTTGKTNPGELDEQDAGNVYALLEVKVQEYRDSK